MLTEVLSGIIPENFSGIRLRISPGLSCGIPAGDLFEIPEGRNSISHALIFQKRLPDSFQNCQAFLLEIIQEFILKVLLGILLGILNEMHLEASFENIQESQKKSVDMPR